MGREIAKSRFLPAEFEEFKHHLKKETALLLQWLDEGLLDQGTSDIGLELEICLVDRDCRPTPENAPLLDTLSDAMVVPELSCFNVEINTQPYPLSGACLSNLYASLQKSWHKVQSVSREMDIHALMIGTVPTMQPDMLVLDYMSNMERFRALNEQILYLREDKESKFKITGRESLEMVQHDVMLEAAGTALQIHLQYEPSTIVRHFNAALIASAPMVALSANSPFLFGKDLWDESRIPIFEQAIKVPGFLNKSGRMVRRVTFGSDYLHKSIAECFLENLDAYPVILPMIYSDGHEWLSHLRLHNGTIWRWNRPIIGMSPKAGPQMRFEHRVPASGPSVVDVIANLAFVMGLTHSLAIQETPPESLLSFDVARSNFYSAARRGLAAEVEWIGGKKGNLQQLMAEHLLPQAAEGLSRLGIDAGDMRLFVDQILTPRVLSGRNGAAWQRSFVETHGRDFQALTERYFQLQESDTPVHEWDV